MLSWDTIAPDSTNLFLRECWEHQKTLYLEFIFFLAQLAFGQGTAHALTTKKVHGVQTG